jgi:hypothetical protein
VRRALGATETRERGALVVPDGVLLLQGGRRVWRLVIEVELHQQVARLYDAELAW